MSIKEDIESIKSDMVGDGKSLEIVIKIERQLKKHKAKIYATFAIAAIIIIANISNKVFTVNEGDGFCWINIKKNLNNLKIQGHDLNTLREAHCFLNTQI